MNLDKLNKEQKISLEQRGFGFYSKCYEQAELDRMIVALNSDENERSNSPVFAIRKVILRIPELREIIFNQKMHELLNEFGLEVNSLTKSIYFDKPEDSNWFVNYHQDISISVKEKIETEGYSMWTVKKGVIGVVPPISILENTVTIRIHLDDTNEGNGALRVLSGSHQDGIQRIENVQIKKEEICKVEAGGLMLMKPLLFHASSRSVEKKRRRVIHLEFCKLELAGSLEWAEKS
ncbi:MAG: hypothetical protein ACI857_000423 [Arenicella sp.]|jgi:hypothetical protein